MGIDILGIDIMGIDILGIDIVALPHLTRAWPRKISTHKGSKFRYAIVRKFSRGI